MVHVNHTQLQFFLLVQFESLLNIRVNCRRPILQEMLLSRLARPQFKLLRLE